MSTDPRLPELFAEALAADAAERERLLGTIREVSPELARAVENLLAAATAGARRFATPAWERRSAEPNEAEAAPPERVGPFRIVREIGRGGMGRVFLAEQESESFRRPVALKLLDRPWAETDAIRRFEEEVRILASLEHPGIARFLDGGRDASGFWYLALEYVEGEDLVRHVERRALPARSRVELFLQVVEAVDYAHRRLVVHRDLKPSNILVGADDRTKLLDFGISKVVDPEVGEATRTAFAALTPVYASPEQLRGERAAVASDVYSLGVVLYELLAGARPFDVDRSPALSLAARERGPRPPSTAAREARDVEGVSGEASAVRWRELSGDLDAIVLKALRVDAEGRYPSASAFADDLGRWLAGRPVAARRGGRRYRLAKFLRRNRVPAAFAALAVVALVVGSVVALAQARASGRERDRALEDLRRAEITNDFSAFLLSEATPEGKPISKAELLARGERLIGRRFADDPALQAHMLLTLSDRFYENFQFDDWQRVVDRAFELTRSLSDRRVRSLAACIQAIAIAEDGEKERAYALIDVAQRELGNEPSAKLEEARCLQAEAHVALVSGDVARAVAAGDRSVAAERARRGPPGSTLEMVSILANAYSAAGRFAAADRSYRELFVILESSGRERTQAAAIFRNNWAVSLQAAGLFTRAAEESERAVALARELNPERGAPPTALWTLGSALSFVGRFDDAIPAVEEAAAKARDAGSPIQLFWALATATRVFAEAARPRDAEKLLRELESVARSQPDFPQHLEAAFERTGARVALARGDATGAVPLARRALARLEAGSRPERELLPVLLVLATAENGAGELEGAIEHARRSETMAISRLGDLQHSHFVGWARLEMARAQVGQGAVAAALATVEKAILDLRAASGEQAYDTLRAVALRKELMSERGRGSGRH